MPGFVDVSNMSDQEIKRLGQADDDYVPFRRPSVQPTEITADQLFGMVVAAHRINGGYHKEPTWDYNQTPAVLVRDANKLMVKRWASDGDFSHVNAADILKGQEVRAHFKSYMLLAIAGKLNDFQTQAYKISQKDLFTSRDRLEMAVASCLPMIYERDRQRKEFMAQLRDSTHLKGSVGDAVEGDLVVLTTKYNINFNKYRVQGKMGESFVDFWFNRAPTVGSNMRIRGKIKALRDDNSTQLNYVKVL